MSTVVTLTNATSSFLSKLQPSNGTRCFEDQSIQNKKWFTCVFGRQRVIKSQMSKCRLSQLPNITNTTFVFRDIADMSQCHFVNVNDNDNDTLVTNMSSCVRMSPTCFLLICHKKSKRINTDKTIVMSKCFCTFRCRHCRHTTNNASRYICRNETKSERRDRKSVVRERVYVLV